MSYRLTRNTDWYIALVHDANCGYVSAPPLTATYDTIGEALYAGANTKDILIARVAQKCCGLMDDTIALKANRES